MSILIITREESEAKAEYKGLAKSISKATLIEAGDINRSQAEDIKNIYVVPSTLFVSSSLNNIIDSLSIDISSIRHVLIEDDVILHSPRADMSSLPSSVITRLNLSNKSTDVAVKHSVDIHDGLVDMLSICENVTPVVFGEAANLYLASLGDYTDYVPSVGLYTTGIYGTNLKHNNGHPVHVVLDKNKTKSIVFSLPSSVSVHSSGSLNGVVKDVVNSEIELPLDLFIPLITGKTLKSGLGSSNRLGKCLFSNIIPLKGESSNISVITKILT